NVSISSAHSSMSFLSTQYFFSFIKPPFTAEIYTLSLHDALPIYKKALSTVRNKKKELKDLDDHAWNSDNETGYNVLEAVEDVNEDRKSTRLNSSHVSISYAVFCLKKKRSSSCLSMGATDPIGSTAGPHEQETTDLLCCAVTEDGYAHSGAAVHQEVNRAGVTGHVI